MKVAQREKRSKFQYDVGEMAKRGYAETVAKIVESGRMRADFVNEVARLSVGRKDLVEKRLILCQVWKVS